ncbi:MAG TPA: hypothetical protein PLY04_18395, partial [bacterium]|nr:hypothetical protein [bacterium]
MGNGESGGHGELGHHTGGNIIHVKEWFVRNAQTERSGTPRPRVFSFLGRRREYVVRAYDERPSLGVDQP